MVKKQMDGYRPDELCGYIFMCNAKTKPQCYRYRVFGLPSGKWEVVAKIKPGMKLFLFDFELRLLYGVYEATSSARWNLEEAAFDGRYPAQVGFRIFSDCLPLLESSFRQAIQHNYRKGTKFSQELNKQQVSNLLSVFRPLKASAPTYLRPIARQVMENQSRLPLPVATGTPCSQRVRHEGFSQHDGYSPSSNTGHGNVLARHQKVAAPNGVHTSTQAYYEATPTNMSHAYPTIESQAPPETTDQYNPSGPMQPYIAEATTTTHQYNPSGPMQPYIAEATTTIDQYNPSGPMQPYIAEATTTATTDQYYHSGHPQPYMVANPAQATTTAYQYYASGHMQPYTVENPAQATTTVDQYYPPEPQQPYVVGTTTANQYYPPEPQQPYVVGATTADQYYPPEYQQPYVVGNPTEAIPNPPPIQNDQSYSAELQQQYVAAAYQPEAASDQYLRYWNAGDMAYGNQQVDAGNLYHQQQQLQENGVAYYYPYPTTTAPNAVSMDQSQVQTTGSAPGGAVTTHSYPHPYPEAAPATQN